jgi:hypothetical protein
LSDEIAYTGKETVLPLSDEIAYTGKETVLPLSDEIAYWEIEKKPTSFSFACVYG